MQKLMFFLIGLVSGVAVTVILLIVALPKLMLVERISPIGFEETVNQITERAKSKNWSVQSVEKLDELLKAKGETGILPTTLINLCKKEFASKILRDDSSRITSVLMPCTISVYQKSDGKTYIGTMNAGLLGKLFGGVIAEIMGGPVAEDQAFFVSF